VAHDGQKQLETAKDTAQANAGLEALGRALRISFTLLIVAMIVGVLVFLKRSVFEVDSRDEGLVLRFGALTGDPMGGQVLAPGVHMTFPSPIDEKIAVPVGLEQNVSTDTWFMYDDTTEIVPATIEPGVHGYALTGDMNMIHCRWVMAYKISDSIAYSFRVHRRAGEAGVTDAGQNPEMERLLACILRSAVVHAAGSMPVDAALLNRDGEFANRVEERVRAEARRLGLGIDVKRVTLDTGAAIPPLQTADAFDAVNRAEEERGRRRAEAENYATRKRNETSTAADRIMADANNYYEYQVNTVAAEADNFNKLYEEYRKNPDVVSQRLYEDTMQRVLAKLERKYVVEQGDGQQLRISLDPGLAKPDPETDAP